MENGTTEIVQSFLFVDRDSKPLYIYMHGCVYEYMDVIFAFLCTNVYVFLAVMYVCGCVCVCEWVGELTFP